MGKYLCVNPCWHGGKKWKKGEIAEFSSDDVPRHNMNHKKDAGGLAHFTAIDTPAAPAPISEGLTPGEVEIKVNDKPQRHR